MRAILLEYAHFTGIDKACAFLLLGTEIFILIHTIGYLLNISRSYEALDTRKSVSARAHTPLKQEPPVALLVAARHEPREVLEETFVSLQNLNYTNKKIYFLDDSSEERYKKEAEELSEELHLTLFRRQERHGAKAGIINDCLKTLSEPYIAIFNADQCPLPDFLNRIIPLMESDQRLAFVQTPQFYTNLSGSRVARAASFQQSVFYEYICEGKSSQESMFCCGTNVVFRKAALEDVHGMDEKTVTEDFATSLKMHLKGWKSLYYDHAYAFGRAPENLSSYFKQQFRWANGTLSVLKQIIIQFLCRPLSLSIRQWWEYVLSGSYYLVGFAFCILMSFPILYLFFNVVAFFATPEIYLLAFLPYIFLSLTIFYSLLKARNYSAKDLFLGQLLVTITFPIYIKAALSAFLGCKVTFQITEKKGDGALPYSKMIPQLFFLLLSFSAGIWGINRFLYERDAALLINSFWALYHGFMLSSILYFNEE